MYVSRVMEMDNLLAAKNSCEQQVCELVFGQNKHSFRKLNTGDKTKLEKVIADSWSKLNTDKLALSFKHVIPWF